MKVEWTSERPTAPGFYWWASVEARGEWCIELVEVEISEYSDNLGKPVIEWFEGDEPLDSSMFNGDMWAVADMPEPPEGNER